MPDTDAAKPRQCYYIPPDQQDHVGFIPSLCTEGKPGHRPFMGNGDCAEPWHWGATREEAQRIASDMNVRDFSLTPAEASEIVLGCLKLELRGVI